MKARKSWWNGCTKEEKRTFYGGIIKEYNNHDKKRWLIQFDNDDEDCQDMRLIALSSMRTKTLVPFVTLEYRPI